MLALSDEAARGQRRNPTPGGGTSPNTPFAGAFNDSRLWVTMSQYGLPLFNDLYNTPAAYHPDVAVLVDETSVLHQQSDWD